MHILVIWMLCQYNTIMLYEICAASGAAAAAAAAAATGKALTASPVRNDVTCMVNTAQSLQLESFTSSRELSA